MRRLTQLSLKTKLTILVAGVPIVVLIVTCSCFVLNDFQLLRSSKVRQLQSQAELLAYNSSAALMLNQEQECRELLEPLFNQPTFEYAALFNVETGKLVASVSRGQDVPSMPEWPRQSRAEFTHDGFVDVTFPIREQNEVIGCVLLRANMKDLTEQFNASLYAAFWFALSAMLFCGFAAVLTSKSISNPIIKLATIASNITRNEDYSARVSTRSHDEIGHLYQAFNRLLIRVQSTQQELRDASEAKSRFLANTSHEIRTPLNAIVGFVDLLRRGGETLNLEDRKDYLDTVHSSSLHLLTLINDILDLSKIEAGQIIYEKAAFAPHQVIASVTSMMRPRCIEKGIRLDYTWDSKVPDRIISDEARFRQLLLNLVSNSVKFTEHGSVTIKATLHEETELLTVAVSDTGIGIAKEQLEMIFSPFVQADTSVTRRFGGTGLGLAICRHIAEGLGGTISVESEPGQGSTFTATIRTGSLAGVSKKDRPIADISIIPSADSKVDSSRIGFDKLPPCHILVVDDGETNRKLIRLLLTRAGATVQTADNGLEAVQIAREIQFDVILMDMQMPIMDGYAATSTLRKEGHTIPIIALTAHAMRGDDDQCFQAGCTGYLSKPLNSEQLLTTLKEILVPLSDTSENSGSRDLSQPPLKSALPIEDPEFAEIVSEFIDQYSLKMASMLKAADRHDFRQLRQLGHWLKGAGGMAGFPILNEAGKRLEESALANDLEAVKQILELLGSISSRLRNSDGTLVY